MLTYLNEEEYKNSVKFLKNRNREIKLEGQSSDRSNQDPRNLFNDTEIEEMEKEKEIIKAEKIAREKEEEEQRIKAEKIARETGNMEEGSYRGTQLPNHYEEPYKYCKTNLGARPKLDMNHEENYIKNMEKYMEDTQRQLKTYEQQESTPNKPNFPNMENFCNEQELDINITRIKEPTEAQNDYVKWNRDATQHKNTRTVYNTKYKNNQPSSIQHQQTRSLNVENKNQDRYNQQKSSSLQTEHQEQFRFHEQAERNPQARNQQRPRYNVPPPNIERNMIINEMNKMGIAQKPNSQQDTSEMETNKIAVEQMRQTFRENEKIIKEEIETQYKTQIINLKRINEEQKQANNHNNATSLSKLNMQENTIQELYKQMDQYKEQLEEATSTNHIQRADLSKMSIELINLKVKEDTYIRTIQDLQRKQQSKEDMEQHYIQTIEDNREIMTELESSNHSQSYNEMRLLNELDEAREKIVQLEKDARNISTKSQQEKDNEVEEQANNSGHCSL